MFINGSGASSGQNMNKEYPTATAGSVAPIASSPLPASTPGSTAQPARAEGQDVDHETLQTKLEKEKQKEKNNPLPDNPGGVGNPADDDNNDVAATVPSCSLPGDAPDGKLNETSEPSQQFAAMAAEMEELRAENTKLKKEKLIRQNVINTLRGRNDNLESQINTQREKIEAPSNRIRIYEGLVARRNTIIEGYEATFEKLETKVKSTQEQDDGLKNLVAELESENAQSQSTIKKLEEENKSVTGDRNRLRYQVNKLETQVTEANSTIKHLTEETNPITNDRDTLNKRVKTLENKKSHLDKEIDQLKQAMNRADTENNTLLAQVSSLESQITQATSQITTLQHPLEQQSNAQQPNDQSAEAQKLRMEYHARQMLQNQINGLTRQVESDRRELVDLYREVKDKAAKLGKLREAFDVRTASCKRLDREAYDWQRRAVLAEGRLRGGDGDGDEEVERDC